MKQFTKDVKEVGMFFSDRLDSLMVEIGNGDIQVCVVAGKKPDKAEMMVVTFKPLNKAQDVGTEVADENTSTERGIGFLIHNLEGLNVLERALAVCRDKLTDSEAK